jgi:hypothetical protein
LLQLASAAQERDTGPFGSLTDFFAHMVLLLVERLLVGLRDVPLVLGGHVTLFVPDLAIIFMQLRRLRLADLAFRALLFDSAVLVCKTLVDLGTTRVVLLPSGLRSAGRRRTLCKTGRSEDGLLAPTEI